VVHQHGSADTEQWGELSNYASRWNEKVLSAAQTLAMSLYLLDYAGDVTLYP
jgi:hypothetical protein